MDTITRWCQLTKHHQHNAGRTRITIGHGPLQLYMENKHKIFQPPQLIDLYKPTCTHSQYVTKYLYKSDTRKKSDTWKKRKNFFYYFEINHLIQNYNKIKHVAHGNNEINGNILYANFMVVHKCV